MIKKLQFNAVGLRRNVKKLIEHLQMEREGVPPENTRTTDKIDRYLDQLNGLLITMDRIEKNLVPRLRDVTSVELKSHELLFIALARPSCRSIFEQLKTHFRDRSLSIPFDELASIGDAGEVLALIGDSVLDMAVLENLWDSSMATKGNLTKQKQNLVSNSNLARFCDELELYEYRLTSNLENKANARTESIDHEKGTLVEALVAVIYLTDGDYNDIVRLVPQLQ